MIPKMKRVEVLRPDGELAVFLEPEEPQAEDAREGLRRARTVAEGKADATALAEALGVSEAQAVRGAVAWALRKIGGES